ncbi:hypothetical protein DAI22_04g091700 [Oryza sativa Japonica Group]|nr:hypothetical protein DAI22_04g091700 [Oryza sativa Japonica Group]
MDRVSMFSLNDVTPLVIDQVEGIESFVIVVVIPIVPSEAIRAYYCNIVL